MGEVVVNLQEQHRALVQRRLEALEREIERAEARLRDALQAMRAYPDISDDAVTDPREWHRWSVGFEPLERAAEYAERIRDDLQRRRDALLASPMLGLAESLDGGYALAYGDVT